jgi:hypothetical protein
MKTIIAGSRNIKNISIIYQTVYESGFDITEVVSGAARGVDKLGEQWATENNIPIKRMPANWNLYGKSAGPIRNNEMADYADALIAIWDGKSKGTKWMIDAANKRGLKIYVKIVNGDDK